MIVTKQEIRVDAAGDGHYGAPRGRRSHRGVDYLVPPEQTVQSDVDGVVTKLGYPYGPDQDKERGEGIVYRYVEIAIPSGQRWRYFYVQPTVKIGAQVEKGNMIAIAQNISARYPGSPMKNHVHLEIKVKQGRDDDAWINPMEV